MESAPGKLHSVIIFTARKTDGGERDGQLGANRAAYTAATGCPDGGHGAEPERPARGDAYGDREGALEAGLRPRARGQAA